LRERESLIKGGYLKLLEKMNIFAMFVLISAKAVCQAPPLSVAKSTITSSGIEIVFRNNSEKPITGLCIRTHAAGVRQVEFLPPHKGILPGATYTETTPLLGLSPEGAEREVATLAITCVVSADGVRGTVPDDVNSMAEALAGTAFQSARLNRFLTSIEDSSNDQFGFAVQDAISRVTALDTTLDDGSKAQGRFASGMMYANALLISRLKRLAAMGGGGGNISELRAELSNIGQEHRNLLEVASAGQRVRP
jgi:hypothetical protein